MIKKIIRYFCCRPVSVSRLLFTCNIFGADIDRLIIYWPSENTSCARIGEQFRSDTQVLEADHEGLTYRGVISDQAKIGLIFAIWNSRVANIQNGQ